MDRRAFLGLATGALVPVTLAAPAHAAGAPARVGVLTFTESSEVLREAFRQGLRDLGYTEGQNIVVEWRAAEGSPERARVLAAELVAAKVDIIVANLTPAVQAAKDATRSIPIVMASAGDPVGTRLVASLTRPGGNVTGLTGMSAELAGKRIELLRELLPGLRRAGLLVNPSNLFAEPLIAETRAAAKRAACPLVVVEVRRPADVAGGFASLKRQRAGAVIVDAAVVTWGAAELAVQHRLPSISNQRAFVDAGGLMSHAASGTDIQRRAASYVDRILKGANPGDLPVEQPTRFELVINLKTAAALGVTVPPSLLARADRVIE